MGRETTDILALAPDLFFGSRLGDAAGALGLGFERVSSPEALLAALDRSRPRLVVVDLAAGVQHLPRVATAAAEARLLAFGPHVNVQARQAALDAGFHEWVSNGRLARELPGLLSRLLGSDAATGDGSG
jgi:ActR/RegA family two-component response regulator